MEVEVKSIPIDCGPRAKSLGTTVEYYGVNEVKGLEVEVHRLVAGDQVFLADLLRLLKFAPNGHHIVGRVTDTVAEAKDRKVFWNFNVEGLPKADFHGEMHFDEETGHHFIVVFRRGNFQQPMVLERIISIPDLAMSDPYTIGDEVVHIGGSLQPEDLIEVKRRVAASTPKKVRIRWSPLEQPIIDAENATRQAAEKAEKDRLAAEAEKRRKEKEKFLKDLLARESLIVYTDAGKELKALPVLGENEWKVLPDGKAVVLVDQYPHPQIVSEFFFVKKARGSGRLSKGGPRSVTLEPPKKAVELQPKARFLGVIRAQKWDKEEQGPVGSPVHILLVDGENFEILKSQKQNSGMLVTKDVKPNGRGRHQVYCFTAEGVSIAGEYIPVAFAS
jgi:hypothetical protein